MSQGNEDETLPIRDGDGDLEPTRVGNAELRAENSRRHIGHYRLISELGHGGQGFVYLAEDPQLRRKVALKVLPEALSMSRAMRLRFEREAEVASRLNHPSIAGVFELGRDGQIPFIAMEYVEGEALSSRLRAAIETDSHLLPRTTVTSTDYDPGSETASGRQPASGSSSRGHLEGICRFMQQVANALHTAHEEGLIHRDIKPANIMVRPDGTPCILDFGLARDVIGDIELTQTGDILGTPAYMAPEQIKGRPSGLDRRCDVYSLGITLYECCTHRRPYAERNRELLYQAIAQTEPVRPRTLNPRVPKDLEAIILTAIDKNPDRRYATAADLADDLERFLSLEPVVARPAGPILKAARWAQRNRMVTALATAVLVALSTASIVFFTKSQELTELNADLSLRTREARENFERANTAVVQREEALADFERLADIKRLERARREARLLRPASSQHLPAIRAWLAAYPPLLDRLPGLIAFRDKLRKKGEPLDPNRPDEWTFHDQSELQFQHDAVCELIAELKACALPEWGLFARMKRRLRQSENIEAATVGEHAAAWQASLDRLQKDPRFQELRWAPVPGLIPLGPDPQSGLEEYLHWLTHKGPLPVRDGDGRIAPTGDTGLILVLIPGSTFQQGAQREDPSAQRYETGAEVDEKPIHSVSLSPFLMSKFESTQGIWLRTMGANEATLAAGRFTARHLRKPITLAHPVENVSWLEIQDFLAETGCDLPTEAQWEYAARSDKNQTWPGTNFAQELSLFGNLAGAELAEIVTDYDRFLRDGYSVHAPAGSFAPNGFGLHDLCGNVWEWCRDNYQSYGGELEPGSGYRMPHLGNDHRIIRGSSFNTKSAAARCADRDHDTEAYKINDVGFRIMMQL